MISIILLVVISSVLISSSKAANSEGCLTPYTGKGGFCLYLDLKKTVKWEDAESYCKQAGGQFAIPKSEAHSKAIRDYVLSITPDSVWLGGSDSETENVWKWTDGTTINFDQFLNWGRSSEGQQPAGGTGQNCLLFWKGYGDNILGDEVCTRTYPALCQAPTQSCRDGFQLVGNICIQSVKTKPITATEVEADCKKIGALPMEITLNDVADMQEASVLKDGERYWMKINGKHSVAYWSNDQFKFATPDSCEKNLYVCGHGFKLPSSS